MVEMTPRAAWELLCEEAPVCVYGGAEAIHALKPLMAEVLAGTRGGQCQKPNTARLPGWQRERRDRQAERAGFNKRFCLNEATMFVEGQHLCSLHGGIALYAEKKDD